MSTSENTIAPLKLSERIQSLDIMRGIVLFGILLMNINGFGLWGAYDNPTVAGGNTGWSHLTWVTTTLFFEGTMRGLLSLLFGVGMFALLERLEKNGAGIEAANIYFRRMLWMLVFGLIHGYLLLWVGEILYNYALMGFLVFSFRNLAPKKLIIAAFILVAAGTLWQYADYKGDVEFIDKLEQAKKCKAEGKELSKEHKAAEEKWEKIQGEKSPETVKENNDNMHKGYFDLVEFLKPINEKFNVYDSYRFDVWDVLSMMLLGIALFKLKILTAEKSFRLYLLMMLFGYGIGLSINFYELRTIIDSNYSFLGFSKSYLTYNLGRIPLAIGHIGLIMIFCKLPLLQWLKNSLSAVGKMALTNYVMHSIICMIIFTGVGFGLYGKLQRHELLYVVFSIWILQLIVSPIWLRYFYFGPLEWLWRYLSYLKKHPFKK